MISGETKMAAQFRRCSDVKTTCTKEERQGTKQQMRTKKEQVPVTMVPSNTKNQNEQRLAEKEKWKRRIMGSDDRETLGSKTGENKAIRPECKPLAKNF